MEYFSFIDSDGDNLLNYEDFIGYGIKLNSQLLSPNINFYSYESLQ